MLYPSSAPTQTIIVVGEGVPFKSRNGGVFNRVVPRTSYRKRDEGRRWQGGLPPSSSYLTPSPSSSRGRATAHTCASRLPLPGVAGLLTFPAAG